MNRYQILSVAGALVLFCMLYFAFDIVPQKRKELGKSRSLTLEATDFRVILNEARKKLADNALQELMVLEREVESSPADSSIIRPLEKLASFWFEKGEISLSGHFAERIAEKANNEDRWAIAGTTYLLGGQKSKNEQEKKFCVQKAINALEMAASFNPENLEHKINLALCYVVDPPADNNMKGILQLIELNKQYPKNPSILFQLGRLAFETGQIERAITRLEEVVAVLPSHLQANCLLAEVFEKNGDSGKAQLYRASCEQLLKN